MVTLGPADNILCCTVMGNRTLREFCEAAGGAGFTAISIGASDYKQARKDGYSDSDIRALLADNGLQIAELEAIFDWLKPLPRAEDAGFDLNLPIFGHAEADFYAIADAIGARSVTVVDPFDSTEPLDQMVEAFAAVCDRAAQHGLLANLEFQSWGPVPNLATGWDIVRTADRPNGGLTVDTLHLTRSGSRDILRSIPSDRIFTTQFCDGRAERVGDAYFDASNREMLCEGEFGLPSLLHDLEQMGCAAPLGFEVISSELAAMSAQDAARLAFASVQRLRSEATALKQI